jgi:hypothetical protein
VDPTTPRAATGAPRPATGAPASRGDDPAPRRIGGVASLVALVRHPRFPRVAAIVAWCWPAIVVAAFYLTWFAAWAALGRRPRPSIDDPKTISILVDAPYFTTGVLFVTSPAAVICGLAAIVAHDRARRSLTFWTVVRSVLFLALWGGAIVLLRWDPFDVMNWFMD